ncbi:aldehyde dehydrogenase family protein [Sphingobium boeckii]|uniref:Acyl-CoA reductase-like NAD-dependent aldehyde dehydrogenase n=1 Tax=Sphingobium boeckii TaxID=1082345 RepID=A0A7W9AH38_9SPHN|nr:aldehyde dehydrogenase family protein [Sphingobium boeckii]MBB5685344.1 acyl-CoA reductase-like NAD-dependent aldehyde dehydrogenase [Sphingobium boeckii]
MASFAPVLAEAGWIARENPARPDEQVGRVREDDAASVAARVTEAATAQTRWVAYSLDQRIAILSAAFEAAATHAPAHAELLSREMGKLIADCLGEIRFGYALARDLLARAPRLLPDQSRGQGPGRRVVRRRPYGVIAAIVPWNAPIVLAMTKIVPALVSGNAIVVKPSPLSPLALSALIESIADHLPEPVLHVVNGGGAVGEALISAPGVAKVAFTGGTAVGGAVLRQASARLVPCVMELGGNDPLILLDDFDPTPDALQAIVWATFLNAGQVCMAAKRLLVPEVMAPRFIDAYVDVARRLFRLGDPLDGHVTMGPLITAASAAHIDRLATHSAQGGGTVVSLLPDGTALPDTGYFLPPRLVTGLDPTAPLVAEEQFGPIVPIVTYRDEADMLAQANAGDLGLSASIWTADPDRGWDTLGHVRAGFGMVNAHNRSGFSFDLPFGGIGASGFGREYGDEGLLEYSVVQSLHQPAARAGGGASYPTPL